MTEEEFVALCEDLGIEAGEALDGLVHDAASKIASGINNSGIEAQLQFLEEQGFSEEEISNVLEAV